MEKASKAAYKTFIILFAIFAIVMFSSQIYTFTKGYHQTHDASVYTVNENISFQGIVARDETVLTYDKEGTINYKIPDGSKVITSSIIAEVYNSRADVLNLNQIENINSQIAGLKRASDPGTTNYVEPQALITKINNNYKSLANLIAKQDYSQAMNYADDMLMDMNIYSVITGKSDNFDNTISQLQGQVNYLSNSAKEPIDKIVSNINGYFSSNCDGYETLVNKSNILKMKKSDVESLLSTKTQAPKNAIGKTFDDYACNIVGVISTGVEISQGDILTLQLSNSKLDYKASVVSITPTENKNEYVIVLSCNVLDDALVSQRIIKTEIVFDKYEGIKVPRDAIKFHNGQKGVVTLEGEQLYFKKIEVIYEGDDFVLVSENNDKWDYLSLYDKILLEDAREEDVNYDGKPKPTDSNSNKSDSK